jgi:hypothetical protein
MKTKGSVPLKGDKSSIMNEIDRIRSYVGKLNQQRDQEVQPKLKIDAAAARRIIEHQTSLGKRKQDELH